MNGFLIFLAVALWFGLKVRKAYQKQMSELGGGTPSDEGTVKNAFESLFDDRQEAKPSNASSPFSSEVGSAGYFSYETEAANCMPSGRASRPSYQAVSTKPADVASVASNDAAGAVDFDLRQAIIYDTILNNKYLSEIQPSEIN